MIEIDPITPGSPMLYDNFTGIFRQCKGKIFKKRQNEANSRSWRPGRSAAWRWRRSQWYDELGPAERAMLMR
jgi:hypothetical protein